MSPAAATGYSGTPLPQKLGLNDGQRVLWSGLKLVIRKELR